MLAGMYAVHDGTTYQVANIAAGHPGSIYYLRPIDGGPMVFRTDATTELTPACAVCNLPAGYQACEAKGRHDGPRKPMELAPLTVSRERYNSRCGCWRADCGECGTRMAGGERRPA